MSAALSPTLAVPTRPRPSTLRALPVQAWAGLLIVAAIALAGIGAPLLAPHPPNEMDLLGILLPPSWMDGGDPRFLLGTDNLGRDILSRLVWGARIALWVGILAAAGAACLGTVLALVAGTLRGWPDWAISRAVELWMSFPPVVLSLLLLVALGSGLGNVVLAIVLVDWTRFCRVIRAEVLVIERQNYVAAARLIGFGRARTIRREVLPGIGPTLTTLFALEIGIAIRVEAVLSFIGMSVPADVPAWGGMIADARPYLTQAPWTMLAPVLAIVVTVIGFNLVGDGLRRGLDPRLLARGGAP